MNSSDSNIQSSAQDKWYTVAFGALYPIIYAHRTVEAAVPEARFACKAVALRQEDSVLDLCCGTGRHLVTLQKTGATLTGIDYSADLLHMARSRLEPSTRLIRADMRHLPFNAAFSVVFSFFTSFGYFCNDGDNLMAACEIHRVLARGGRFFMDYLNPLNLESTLKKETVRVVEEYTLQEQRWIDDTARRVNKRIEVIKNGRQLDTIHESVRLYRVEELSALLKKAGLRVISCLGDYSGAPYNADSHRMILTGVKAAP